MKKLMAGLALFAGAAFGQVNAASLTASQVQSAIQKGQEYKSPDKFLSKGLLGRRVEIGRYTTVTFFNDWQDIALASAEARFEMRELKVVDTHPVGLLHAYVEVQLNTNGFTAWNLRDAENADAHSHRSNLVITISGNAIQPVARRVVANKGHTVVMAFDFAVSPEDLLNPVTVTTIDGDDGRRHHKTADLAGILSPEWDSRH